MKNSNHKAIAIVGVGAIMPDAIDLNAFWNNIKNGRYSISDVPKGRWDPDLYYDPDPKAPDKTYSRIGGWVRVFNARRSRKGIHFGRRVRRIGRGDLSFARLLRHQVKLHQAGADQQQRDRDDRGFL